MELTADAWRWMSDQEGQWLCIRAKGAQNACEEMECGKVYEDQNRKICGDCTNHSKVMVRLFQYLKNYRLSLFLALFIAFKEKLMGNITMGGVKG